MKVKSYLKTVAIALFLCTCDLFSQGATPIVPEEERQPKDLGIIIGLGMNLQSGTSKVNCENCEFEDGTKFGFSLGAVYENGIVDEKLKWGIIGLYDNLDIYSSFKERESFEYEPNKFIPVNFRHHSELSVSAFSVIPYLKWSPAKVIFLRVGPNISYLVSTNVLHTKEILDKTTELPTGEITSISFPDTKSKKTTVEDGEYKDVNNLQFGLSLMSGFNFQFDNDFTFAPYFMYNIPFTNISEYGKDLKISSWRIIFEFRMKI